VEESDNFKCGDFWSMTLHLKFSDISLIALSLLFLCFSIEPLSIIPLLSTFATLQAKTKVLIDLEL